MVTILLEKWTVKVPAPRFSKSYLEDFSPQEFKDLVREGILIYDLPSGEESTDEQHCQHGCPLFVEEVNGRWEAICLEHPQQGIIAVEEDQLSRYKLSVENFLKIVRKVNKIEGKIIRCGQGYYFGHKIYNGRKIGLAFFPSITKHNLSKLAESVVWLKDYDYIFVFTPNLYGAWRGTMPSFGDRLILLDVCSDALDGKTLEIPFDWHIFRSNQGNVFKDAHLEFTGNKDMDGYEIRINGSGGVPFRASFIFLLRLALSAVTKEDRWVSISELISESIVTEDSRRRVIRGLKEPESWIKWDKFIENDGQRYRFSSNVVRFVFNRSKLARHADARIESIIKKLP